MAADRTEVRGWWYPIRTTVSRPWSRNSVASRPPGGLTTHASAWFVRDESPPGSGVSPIRDGCGSHRGARLVVPHPNHGLTTVVTKFGGLPAARGTDHARQCVVRTGRKSSSLGRKPDPGWLRIAPRCEVGGTPSEPRSHDRGHEIRWPPGRQGD